MLDPTTEISIKASAAEWNDALGILSGGVLAAVVDALSAALRQHRVAQPLLAKITAQAMEYDQPSAPPMAAAPSGHLAAVSD